jgi:DNA (cytosine-5)-methyltransferase 1
MKDKKYTYISLFSSAGVGCYGFKMENFECVATNELIERRLNVQKANHKCKYDSGYICGDITKDEKVIDHFYVFYLLYINYTIK